MNKAIILSKAGDKQVLKVENVETKKPGKGQVLVRNIAIGINKDDIGVNISKGESFAIPGFSASGDIIDIGVGVKEVLPKTPVAYMSKDMGCYQEYCIVDVNDLVVLPKEISYKTAAASYFSCMIAHALVRRVYLLRPRTIVLIHDIASETGYILTQWAKNLGAFIIGTVDNDDKNDFAIKYGCDKVVNYNSEFWEKEVLEITRNHGVNIVYDSLGSEVFDKGIKCLTQMGIMVSYGIKSQTISQIERNMISEKSLYITFPSVFDYKSNRMELLLSADDIFSMINSKQIKINIDSEYNFETIKEAHQKLRNNSVCGSMIMNTEVK